MRKLAYIVSLLVSGMASAQMDSVYLPFRALTIEDGLSQGMVVSMEQDRFGFMWFATKDGLNRYDGYSFTTYRHNPEDPHSLSSNYTTVVHEGLEGHIWVGTASGGLDVYNRKTGKFAHVDLGPSANDAYVMNIEHDRHGALWVATNAGLYKVLPNNDHGAEMVQRYFTVQSRIIADKAGRVWGYLKSEYAFRITPAKDHDDKIDTLWMDALAHGPWTEDLNTNINGHFVQDPVNGRIFGIYPFFIAEYDTSTLQPTIVYQVEYPEGQRLETDQVLLDDKENMWIGANRLYRFNTHSRQMTRVLSGDPNLQDMLANASITFMDSNGLFWAGTLGYGLVTYDPRIERFNPRLDGSVYWMQSTDGGKLICQRMGKFLRVYDPEQRAYILDIEDKDPAIRRQLEGLVHETHAAIQETDGTFWLAKRHLINYDPTSNTARRILVRNEQGEVVERRKGLFPLYNETDHLWFGTDSAFYSFNKRTEAFQRFPYPIESVHMPYLFAQAARRDANGVFWIGTVRGLLRLDPESREWKHFKHNPNDSTSLSFDLIFSLMEDPKQPERYLWIGTNGGGLNRLDKQSGQFIHFTEKDGLPNDVVYGILPDDDGNLWMSTNKGIARFSPSSGQFKGYASSDGLQSNEFNRNAFCSMPDGTLFFGGVVGHNHFHPKDLREDQGSATVRLTDIKLLNRTLVPSAEGPLYTPAYLSEGMEVAHNANMITFEFASMEFSSPLQHEYQYQLEGFDAEPIMAGTRHSAVYTNLDPGTYRFVVRAQNRDGIWGDDEASFHLTVLPPWWRTWWAYALYTVLLLGALLLYVFWQRWQRKRLEATVTERTGELQREKERSEELLRNILPAEVADELRSAGRTEAKQYDQVSILFSDFQGFTGISEKMGPGELVDELNVCFRAFDRIMEKHGVEKIKTIGDSYMAAGGVPDPKVGAPLDVVHAALEMQEIIAERKSERSAAGRPYFEMRVGIHTGPVVAGIVGLKKFQYDIWGDTVNIASRMESSGEVGKVNISGATYGLVSRVEDLDFESRGMVKAKGKGKMEMYFVSRITSKEDTASSVAFEPNAANTDGEANIGAFITGAGRDVRVDLTGLRVLLVEDNDFNAMVAQDELADAIEQVQVQLAKNGKLALELVEKNNYDLVLMDVQMPVMNGYEATQAIRALKGSTADIPVVAMTANVMKAEVQRCMEAGMNGFVPKPFKREELIATLQSVLGAKSAAIGPQKV